MLRLASFKERGDRRGIERERGRQGKLAHLYVSGGTAYYAKSWDLVCRISCLPVFCEDGYRPIFIPRQKVMIYGEI